MRYGRTKGPGRLEIVGSIMPQSQQILTDEALGFVGMLATEFVPAVDELLKRRQERRAGYLAGERPRFLEETAAIRNDSWTAASPPSDLRDRRVEITAPVERKMMINAFNSGANVFMADFEDSLSPTWPAVMQGQINLKDAVAGSIQYVQPGTEKIYALEPQIATLMVRPRGWHLFEEHVRLAGRSVPAALVDFGLFFFHNARLLLTRGTAPYFYLPKLESHLEARLWNEVFLRAQEEMGLPAGTIRATVLIETLPAAFEMDEILHELRQHSAGLNCGRWDYIFSAIKTLGHDSGFLLPDRQQVTMQQPFLRAYTQLLVKTCHRRGVHAMGGMAAQIPIKNDPDANQHALELVRADKLREVRDGHDGTWVAHPGLVSIAREVFDAYMPGPNQLHVMREDVHVTAADLLRVPEGTRTEKGLRHNIRVGVQYLEAWLDGLGCVPLYNLMEDAATAEICRTQIWQWLRHRATLDDGLPLTIERVHRIMDEELAVLATTGRGQRPRLKVAGDLFETLCTAETLAPFLTVPAYQHLLSVQQGEKERFSHDPA